jgi:hypothetical protein
MQTKVCKKMLSRQDFRNGNVRALVNLPFHKSNENTDHKKMVKMNFFRTLEVKQMLVKI